MRYCESTPLSKENYSDFLKTESNLKECGGAHGS